MDKNSKTQVIGIASGKGGVGKTTVSVNLAVALAQRGHKVMLLDADLGMANAQIALGAHAPFNVGHVLRGDKTLQEVVVTAEHGVRLVPGASGLRDMAALDSLQIASLVHAFDTLTEQVDFLLVDVAAGISPSVLEIMAACQRRYVVVCDQPSSIADAYGLIKVMTLEQGLDEIYLVPNLVADVQQGKQLYRRMNDVCNRFLGVPIRYAQAITADEMVVQAMRKYQSVMQFSAGTAAARDFRLLAEQVDQLPALEHASGRIQFFMERMLRPGH